MTVWSPSGALGDEQRCKRKGRMRHKRTISAPSTCLQQLYQLAISLKIEDDAGRRCKAPSTLLDCVRMHLALLLLLLTHAPSTTLRYACPEAEAGPKLTRTTHNNIAFSFRHALLQRCFGQAAYSCAFCKYVTHPGSILQCCTESASGSLRSSPQQSRLLTFAQGICPIWQGPARVIQDKVPICTMHGIT